MRGWLGITGRILVWPALAPLALGGCDGLPDLTQLPAAVAQAGHGTAGRTSTRNVIPSKPAQAVHQIQIEDERYLGDIARQLGVSVDGILRDNAMAETVLQRGMVLQVRTTRDLIVAFEARREQRKIAKAAAEEAKRQARLKAAAEARAARRLARLQARRDRRLGVHARRSDKVAAKNGKAEAKATGSARPRAATPKLPEKPQKGLARPIVGEGKLLGKPPTR